MATEEDLLWIRRKIGSGEPPTDEDLDDALTRLGDRAEVAREILDTRLAELRSQPTSVSVAGEYSRDTRGQIEAIERQLATDSDLLAVSDTHVRIVHPDPRPRR
jgi:hypothetical protein